MTETAPNGITVAIGEWRAEGILPGALGATARPRHRALRCRPQALTAPGRDAPSPSVVAALSLSSWVAAAGPERAKCNRVAGPVGAGSEEAQRVAGPFIVKTVSRIHAGKAAEYRHLAEEICHLAEQREPRLLAFHTYVTDDESSEVVVQIHPDAESMQHHLQELGEKVHRDRRVHRLREPGDLRRAQRCAAPVAAPRHRRDHFHSSFDSLGWLHTAARHLTRRSKHARSWLRSP